MDFETPQDRAAFDTYRDAFNPDILPKGFRRLDYDAWSEEERAEWFQERFRCVTDHLYLSSVLGWQFQENPHRYLFNLFVQYVPGMHLFDLERERKKLLVLWPRGHFKSTSLIVDAVQKILAYPDIRIGYMHGVVSLAKVQLDYVKRTFKNPTPRFLHLFPEFCLVSVNTNKNPDPEKADWFDTPPKWGTAMQFSVPCRTQETTGAAPTFQISTARSTKAGSHYHIIYVDDLVNEQNYDNPEQLVKTYTQYLSMIPLLDPNGYLVMVGTRYSYDDTYETIMVGAADEDKKTGRSVWKISVTDCWSYDCKHCGHPRIYHDKTINILQPPCQDGSCTCRGFESLPDKKVLFPEFRTEKGATHGFTVEKLDALRRELIAARGDLGAAFFANQYENNPIAEEMRTFTEVLIAQQTLFDMRQIPDFQTASLTFIVGDFAESEDGRRDQSVLFAVRKHIGRLFVFGCAAGRWNSAELISNIMAMIRHPLIRPKQLFFEKTLGWEHLNNLILARATELGLPMPPITWLPAGNKKGAKMRRIGNCQEAMVSKRLWLYGGMGEGGKDYMELVSQLKHWPRAGKHDDYADCLGRVVEAPSGYESETPPPPPTALNWLHRLSQNGPSNDDYPDTGGGNGLACG